MTTTTRPAVLAETRGAVRTVTLNRPGKRNAIDLEMRVALADAIEGAAADDAIRVIVITGARPAFCSGGDISTMKRTPPGPALERVQLAQRVVRAIWHTRKPVLAAVEGSAYGAGTALAAACDRVVAANDARFATTFTSVGLAGDMGIFVSLPARVGAARARQMLMLPAAISAAEALAIGLIDAVAAPGQALASAHRDAERLAAGPAQALGVIKTMLAAAPRTDPFDALDTEAACQAALFDTDDFAEGVTAFQQKRRPVFGDRKE
jgi:2-(1,2-epoxy-1,2-dihydrophenyl)acetyl-CoA isomerase